MNARERMIRALRKAVDNLPPDERAEARRMYFFLSAGCSRGNLILLAKYPALAEFLPEMEKAGRELDEIFGYEVHPSGPIDWKLFFRTGREEYKDGHREGKAGQQA